MQKVQQIFQMHFPLHNWNIKKPLDGKRKECYSAICGDKKVFIKFDVPISALKRLGDIQVAPKVLFSGQIEGETYVIQEYIEGTYPDKRWIVAHFETIAQMINIYHGDKPLIKELCINHTPHYFNHFTQDFNAIYQLINKYAHLLPKTEEFTVGYKKLMNEPKDFQIHELVPVHNEPNNKNMLLNKERIVFIDWDEITLSDPLRDIGVLLWWYFREEKWQKLLLFFGLNYTEAAKKKIYWFAARTSLVVSLWYVEQNIANTSFNQDFLAAINHKPNPKGY